MTLTPKTPMDAARARLLTADTPRNIPAHWEIRCVPWGHTHRAGEGDPPLEEYDDPIQIDCLSCGPDDRDEDGMMEATVETYEARVYVERSEDIEHLRTALTEVDRLTAEASWLMEDLIGHTGATEAEIRECMASAGHRPALGHKMGAALRERFRVQDECSRLTAENARLREALAWALGEGEDPGAWPEGVAPHPQDEGWADLLGAPSVESIAISPALDPGQVRSAILGIRRKAAARRILAEVTRG